MTPQELIYRDMVCVTYTCTTDGDRLADYLPEGFELLRPELLIGYTLSVERSSGWRGQLII